MYACYKQSIQGKRNTIFDTLCLSTESTQGQVEADRPCTMCGDCTEFDRNSEPTATPTFHLKRIGENNYLNGTLKVVLKGGGSVLKNCHV